MSLFDIQKITVGPETLIAQVHLPDDAPLSTSDDIEATSRIYQMMPQIANHTCISEYGDRFRDALGSTSLAHLLEHMTVELVAQVSDTEVIAGNTREGSEERTWEIELTCPDDVLVISALSSANWICGWAFTGGADPAPGLDAIVGGLKSLLDGLNAS
ncbi:MAG: hypothetical protein IKE43_07265 [Coriobacteriales bacterium]|nr:hypothetical protein [Coriobacteriales bacterium]